MKKVWNAPKIIQLKVSGTAVLPCTKKGQIEHNGPGGYCHGAAS